MRLRCSLVWGLFAVEGIELVVPGELEAELDLARTEYNGIRLHAALQYVTPNDEHERRGDAIRTKRRDGLAQARANRIVYRRLNDGAHPGENR